MWLERIFNFHKPDLQIEKNPFSIHSFLEHISFPTLCLFLTFLLFFHHSLSFNHLSLRLFVFDKRKSFNNYWSYLLLSLATGAR